MTDSENGPEGHESPVAGGPEAYFDKAAATWDDNARRVAMASVIANGIRDEIPLRPDMRILDFGCGTGLVTRQLAPHVAFVTAADTSSEMLRVLAEKAQAAGLKGVKTLLLETGYPLPTGASFDVIVSSMVFHHVEDIGLLLERFASWLRPDGWVAIADLEPEDGSFHSDNPHVVHHGIDPSTIRAQLERLGFAVKRVHTVHTIQREVEGTSAMRKYPIFLLTARKGR